MQGLGESMAEIRPYKKEYFSRRNKVVSFVFLALLAVAAAGLAFWYFASRTGSLDVYAGKVVRISGSLEDVAVKGVVAAGTDAIALDALGAELLGLVPSEQETLRDGAAAGLGSMDYRALAGAEIAVS